MEYSQLLGCFSIRSAFVTLAHGTVPRLVMDSVSTTLSSRGDSPKMVNDTPKKWGESIDVSTSDLQTNVA